MDYKAARDWYNETHHDDDPRPSRFAKDDDGASLYSAWVARADKAWRESVGVVDDEFVFRISGMGNDAFSGDRGVEVARLLREVADQVEWGRESGVLMDVNGNSVGEWGFGGRLSVRLGTGERM